MNFHSIEDFGLNAAELADRYQRYDYHFWYTRPDWERSGTEMSYWDWVEDQLKLEQDMLERDNPYGRYSI